MVNRSPVYRLVLVALTMALVTLMTMIIQIPNPASQGYINFGDSIIFVTGVVFGPFFGLLAGGIGSALADLLSGYAQYAPWTLIIKGLEGLIVGLIAHKAYQSQRKLVLPVLGMVVAGAWMVAGYLLAESVMYGVAGAVVNVPGNLVQAVVSLALAIPLLVPVWHAFNRNKR